MHASHVFCPYLCSSPSSVCLGEVNTSIFLRNFLLLQQRFCHLNLFLK